MARAETMKADVELVLEHQGDMWVARNEHLVARGGTLSELDESVKRELIHSRMFPAGSNVTVFMGCDRRMIPAWMRQYHSHYFNRIVCLELSGTNSQQGG